MQLTTSLMRLPIFHFLKICVVFCMFAELSAIQSEPTMDRRGLLGVVLDGDYMPMSNESRLPRGVRIAEIQPGLAADRANLQNGDVVLSVNDQSVSSVRELQVAIASKTPGSKILLTVSRNGDVFMRDVTLGDWFDFLVRTPGFGPFIEDVSLALITAQTKAALRLPEDLEGLLVTRILDRSLYQFVFREGMVITSVNGVSVMDRANLKRALVKEENVYRYYLNGVYGSFSLLKD